MLKLLVALGAGVISFLVVFSFVTRDEIAQEVDRQLDDDFVPQCTRRLDLPPQVQPRAADVCACMKAEFAAKGLKLTDTMGDDLPEMRRITASCVALYD